MGHDHHLHSDRGHLPPPASYWTGFLVALVAGMLLGAVCQLTIIRPTMKQAAAQRGDS